MKINTNSKNIESLIIPDTYYNILVGNKVYSGALRCFRAQIIGHYKNSSGTKTLNSSSDSSSNTIIFQSDGKIYKNGSLDGGEYEYIEVTSFGTNGVFKGMGVVI